MHKQRSCQRPGKTDDTFGLTEQHIKTRITKRIDKTKLS